MLPPPAHPKIMRLPRQKPAKTSLKTKRTKRIINNQQEISHQITQYIKVLYGKGEKIGGVGSGGGNYFCFESLLA
jgi:hypothetical protein